MALVAVLYGMVERLRLSRTNRALLHGFAFGLGAVSAMSSPALLAPGILVDTRATFIALAGAFVGPLAAIVAVTMSALYRVWIGGAGLVPGLLTLTIAFSVGILWRYAWYKRRPVTPLGLSILALGISLQNGLILLLPVPMSAAFTLMLVAALTASALFATLVLGGMMMRENRLIARERTLTYDAYTDPLTTLPNRRALMKAEPRLLEVSATQGYALLLFDIDHFKSINDRYGHDVGDAALCVFGSVLREGLRAGDMVVRFGGEEFVVVLPAMQPAEGAAVAERLIASVRERRVVMPEADFAMTASVGFVHAHGGVALADAIARADDALYEAKAGGRDCMRAAAPFVAPASRRAQRIQPSRKLDPSSLPLPQRAP